MCFIVYTWGGLSSHLPNVHCLPSLPPLSLTPENHPPRSTMKLLSAFATASLATAALYAREDVVTTIVTTLAEETTSYVVVDGQTEETGVSGSPSVVEVAARLWWQKPFLSWRSLDCPFDCT